MVSCFLSALLVFPFLESPFVPLAPLNFGGGARWIGVGGWVRVSGTVLAKGLAFCPGAVAGGKARGFAWARGKALGGRGIVVPVLARCLASGAWGKAHLVGHVWHVRAVKAVLAGGLDV